MNRGLLGLTCKRYEQTGKCCAGLKRPSWMSPAHKRSYYSCQTLKSYWCVLRSTVLQNFSSKTRNTVSVREGQAVVLLCGPPPHYGGTAHLPDSLSAVLSHSCLPQQSLLFPYSAAYYLAVTLQCLLCFYAFPPSLSAALPSEPWHTVFHSLLLICQTGNFLWSAAALPAQTHAFIYSS